MQNSSGKVKEFPRAHVKNHLANKRLNTVVGAFESETYAVFAKTAPASEHWVLYVLIGMVALSIYLSSVVHLERVVTGLGKIQPVGGFLFVSPYGTGIVKQVMVKPGDVVHKGQILASLDGTFADADFQQWTSRQASDLAVVSRLEAEQANLPYAGGADPAQQVQMNIREQRLAEYTSTLADYDARIHSLDAQVAQARNDSAEYAKRLKLAKDVEKMYQPLMEKGYVSKLQWMSANDSRVEMGRLQAEAEQQIHSNQQTMASLNAQRDAFIKKWYSDIGDQLVAARKDLDEARQNLEKAKLLKDLQALEAPQDAVVLKIGKISTGAIASSASNAGDSNSDPLFTLVPLDAPVETEINVEARDIGFIKVGDPVQLKLDAYRFLQHGTAKGTIKSISEGSFTMDDNNQPVSAYFKVRIAITDVHLRNVPSEFRLIPGMTLQGDILVGQRTILSYLLEGALRTGSEAMREPG